MNEQPLRILNTLATRLKQTRLNANLTQQQVAEITGMSRTAIEGAEKGKCTLATFVNILVALGADEAIDSFLMETPISPLLLAETQGKKRQRASTAKNKNGRRVDKKDDLGW